MIILYEIVCFHLVFSFCVDLVGMVKIMQKHAKLEQKVEKVENHENQPKPVDWLMEPVDWIIRMVRKQHTQRAEVMRDEQCKN